MTVANQPIGWQPETTDATVYAVAAVSKGDCVRLTGNFSGTSGNAYGVPGLTWANATASEGVAEKPHVFAICLEDASANGLVRVRIRGRVWASVEKETSAITANQEMVVGGDDTTATHSLMLAADVGAIATVENDNRKVVALAEEAGDATTGTEDHIWVLFNGAEGFGVHIPDTAA